MSALRSALSAKLDDQKIVNLVVWVMMVCGAIAFIEPSPYDLFAVVTLPLWVLGGFTVHRSFLPFAFMMVAYTIAGYLALIPHWDNPDATYYQYLTTYLTLTALFFALFFAERTRERSETILSGYTIGAFIAAACGVIGYFDIAGLGQYFTRYGRAEGTFKDPNVFGPFLVLPIVYLSKNLMLSRERHAPAAILALVVIVAGDLLSFSRGSWAATISAMTLSTTASYVTTSDARLKRRIKSMTLASLAIGALVLIALLSMPTTREFFMQRAALQEYDEGPTGRFGNQLRSLPDLLDRFWGFGPLLFRLKFGLEPHNSYIGAFANTGWIGGLLFVLLIGVTVFVGFRLMFRPSPFQRHAQVFAPVLFSFFLQAFQIDFDHWRHVLLLYGAVWGLEAARQKWEAKRNFGQGGITRDLLRRNAPPSFKTPGGAGLQRLGLRPRPRQIA